MELRSAGSGNIVVARLLWCVCSALPPSPSFGSHLRDPVIIALGTFPPLTVLAAGGHSSIFPLSYRLAAVALENF